jgi:hypothetical protein
VKSSIFNAGRRSFNLLSLFAILFTHESIVFSQNTLPQEIVVGDPEFPAAGDRFTLDGRVVDNTGEILVGASIQVTGEAGRGTYSDQDGLFTLVLDKGSHDIILDFLGYEARAIRITMYESGSVQLTLVQSGIELEQVVIRDRSSRDNIEQIITGLEQMSIQELRQSSSLLGELDVIRSIQSLSGVTSAGDGASGFNVRGGNADENLILQDDALIMNPSHTLGFFSLFHPDMVSQVNLYKGNQPAYLGGRLSSVLDVKLREGDTESFGVNGGIGFVSSRLTIEGPIKKNKSSFIIGGRASYMDWVLDLINNINVQRSKAFFYDLTAKADARLGTKTKVGFTTFLSADEFQFAQEVNFEYDTKTVSGYVNHLINDQWTLNLVLNIGDYNSSLFDIQGNDVSKFTNGVTYLRPSLRSIYQIDDTKRISVGVNFDQFTVAPGTIAPESETSTVQEETLPDEKAYALAPNIQFDWDISEKLTFAAGLRYTQYNRVGSANVLVYEPGGPKSETRVLETLNFGDGESIATYSALEPRISLLAKFSENSSVKLSFDRGFQYLNQISNTASSTPIDIWQLSDYHIQPQSAYNYTVGYFRNFKEGKIQTSVQAFYRQQPDIIEYRDFADLILNEFIERELVDGEGRAYGIELNFEQSGEKSEWKVNYTFSRSERLVLETPEHASVNNGEWFPSNYDKPHVLNLRFTQKFSRMSALSVNFTYSTGRPLTAPVSNFTVDNIKNIPIYSNRNEFRIPDYHRLDVSYSIGPFGRRGERLQNTLVFSIFNIYGRDNAYSVFFRQLPSSRVQAMRVAPLGAAFPSITYNFRF